ATLTGGGTVCTTQSTTLTATVIGGTPPYTLTLTNGGGTQTGNSPLTFTVSPLTTTTYAIQSGTDANGNPITGNGNATVTVNFCAELSSLLVADTMNNRIQRFNGTTWSVVGPGTVGAGTGQFRTPEAVTFNQTGRIYVADTGNNRLQWSTNGGTTWAVFATGGSGLNQVNGPRGLALDQNGNLYVADSGNNRVVRFNNGVPGNAVILATNGTTTGRVQNPNGLAIDTTFNLFIADTGNNRIQKITNAGTQTVPNTGTVVAGVGSGLTSVRMPQGVAVDSAGNLYIADTGNNRITRFAGGTPGTATLVAGSGTALGQVRAPEGVTISSFSTGPLAGGLSLIVSDTSNNRIQGRFLNAPIWGLVGTPNGLGSSPGQFRIPSKIR
ncbi:MAG TPA: NHL repeat-containing protein, partial [Acidobacteriota bacterium]|nr:NHL repeat-containing protein [Acidobacteriota bacterium]